MTEARRQEAGGDVADVAVFVGRYVIRRRLGRGGMATVYEAADPAGTAVALKVFHPHVIASRSLLER